MFPAIEIFGKTIGMYSLLALVGAVAVVIFFVINKKRTGFDAFDLSLFLLIIVAGLLIGGHLLYGITQYNLIFLAFSKIGQISFKDFVTVIAAAFSGNVFYGGLIGSFVALAIYLKVRMLGADKNRSILDVYSCSVPLFHAFGRIGCFLGGCCYGIESSFGFTAHGNEFSPDVNDVNRFPVQLLESFLNVLLFVALVIVLRKGLLRGNIIWLYGLIYSVIRFSDEFLRGDVIRGFVLGLSTSQWISIFIFVLSTAMLIRYAVKRGTEPGLAERGTEPGLDGSSSEPGVAENNIETERSDN